jgi:hypothetical protein
MSELHLCRSLSSTHVHDSEDAHDERTRRYFSTKINNDAHVLYDSLLFIQQGVPGG